mgnify:CR=1 FL=1
MSIEKGGYMNTEKIKNLSKKYYDRIVEIRHRIHMHPELAFQEHETSKLIANELMRMGIEVQNGIAKTGVVGLIKGEKPGKTILLRADMDALEVQEAADVPYKSKIKGKMHACGHDGHIAGVLGAAMILNDLKDELHGNIKLVFQPAEETEGGAKPMIELGIMENPHVDAAIGCHLWGSFKEGEVHIKEGPVMASPDVFTFKIIGKGGHAGIPHLSIDPIVITSQVICSIQSIVSRRVNPLKPVVISCCSIHGGETNNVIPNEVEVKGTVRTFHQDLRNWIPEAIEEILKTTTKAYGGSYEFEYSKRFPPLINNEKMAKLAMNSISKIIGEENVHKQEEANMGGEDFAYFASIVPSVYYFIGITPKNSDTVIHHHPKFGFNDTNLLILSQSMAQVAIDYLNEFE